MFIPGSQSVFLSMNAAFDAGLMAGVSTLTTYISYGSQIYSAFQSGKSLAIAKEDALNKADADYRKRKTAEENVEPIQATFGGTMGSKSEHEQKDYLMFNMMFNPFDHHPQAVPAYEIDNGLNKF